VKHGHYQQDTMIWTAGIDGKAIDDVSVNGEMAMDGLPTV
jgi:hypothetical protein